MRVGERYSELRRRRLPSVPQPLPWALSGRGRKIAYPRSYMRPSQRAPDQLRPVRMSRRYTRHAEGSVLVEFGDTQVICTASVLERQPPHLKGTPKGWVTAEYGMLPRSTHTR